MTSFSTVLRRLSRRRNPPPSSSQGPLFPMAKRKPTSRGSPSRPSPKKTSLSTVRSAASVSRLPVTPKASDCPIAAPIVLSPVPATGGVTSPKSGLTPVAQSQISNLDPSSGTPTWPEHPSTIDEGAKVGVSEGPAPIVLTGQTIKEINPLPVNASAKNVLMGDQANNKTHVATLGDSWSDLFKGGAKKLTKKGNAFTLPSGEACVEIPNSVIEKNKSSWKSFILGQFYSEPPSQGIVHSIVNGIWSRQFRDVSVTKMEGFAYLFRIPNAATRARVLNQRLWSIEGQTMFVANWEPGFVPTKPELTSAPIWLELRQVPLQFFNEEGLEHIAGLVGEPKFLHPTTANKTNLEVAKVFTIIDPRKPLPEAVHVKFQSGEIRRVTVSSPWMPPVCTHCKEIGHSFKHCKKAPITCTTCNSSSHTPATCPRPKAKQAKGKDHTIATQRQYVAVNKEIDKPVIILARPKSHATHAAPPLVTHLGSQTLKETVLPCSEAESDSSVVESSESSESSESEEEGELIEKEGEFTEVRSRKKKKEKNIRDKGPKKL